MKILGLCGSLRLNSSNGFILKAAKAELHDRTWLDFDLAALPYFDPDKQFSADVSDDVRKVRALAADADVLFVATPEYAHGMPGILKNAFEWIFHEGTQKKPVYIVIGSADGASTQAQLLDVLATMDFTISSSHILRMQGARSRISAQGEITDANARNEFRAFCNLVRSAR